MKLIREKFKIILAESPRNCWVLAIYHFLFQITYGARNAIAFVKKVS